MENKKKDNNGKSDVKKMTFYRHGRTSTGIRFTICAIAEENVITLNHSRCSKKDQFVKRIGRKIAYGRTLKEHNSIVDGRIRQSFKLDNSVIRKQVKDIMNKYFDHLIQSLK